MKKQSHCNADLETKRKINYVLLSSQKLQKRGKGTYYRVNKYKSQKLSPCLPLEHCILKIMPN